MRRKPKRGARADRVRARAREGAQERNGGTFDWTVRSGEEPRFPGYEEPAPSYHGEVYADLGAPAFA
ncbi:hypothetical protein, partial [Nocardia brasiliensis]|uniref:hypothetical protein n=1 Tax=Nocardia brasiliensis TaxID=37326 RepID=UPI0024588D79